MIQVFKKDLTFISKVAGAGTDGNTIEWKEEEITKTAVFNELSRTERSQRKLTFKILSVIETGGIDVKNGKINLDTDGLADLTDAAIEALLVVDAKDFTEQDKAEFLNDNIAVLNFGTWFFGEKIAPFFSQLKKT